MHSMEILLFAGAPKHNTHAVRACVSCQKRKSKCEGGNPCSYCVRKNIECEFIEAKKRGPVSKKRNVDSGVEFLESLSDIQETMNKLFQQYNFVDFYYNFIGVTFPEEFKIPLLSKNINKNQTTQLCIIFAHITRDFGNAEASKHYIEKAQENAVQLFNSDNMDSVLSLLMMSLYDAYRSHKGGMYANMALAICNSPEIMNTMMGMRMQSVAKSYSIVFDNAVPFTQRQNNILANMPRINEYMNPFQKALISLTKFQAWTTTVLKLDWYNHKGLVQNIANPIEISKEDYGMIVDELVFMETVLDNNMDHISYTTYNIFKCHIEFCRFCLTWRTGNNEGAKVHAKILFNKFREHTTLPGILFNNTVLMLLLVPYFYQKIGDLKSAEETIELLTNCYTKLGRYIEVENACKLLGIGKFTSRIEEVPAVDLLPLLNPEEMDQMLRGFPSNSDELDFLFSNSTR